MCYPILNIMNVLMILIQSTEVITFRKKKLEEERKIRKKDSYVHLYLHNELGTKTVTEINVALSERTSFSTVKTAGQCTSWNELTLNAKPRQNCEWHSAGL